MLLSASSYNTKDLYRSVTYQDIGGISKMEKLELQLSERDYQLALRTGRLPVSVLNRAVAQAVNSHVSSNGLVSIAREAEDNGTIKTQQNWVADGNQKGVVYASSADVMAVGYANKDKTLIESLQEDFKKRWLTTSTHNSFKKGTELADITHYWESKVRAEKPIKGIKVPVLQGERLKSKIQDTAVLTYLKALADKMNMTRKQAEKYVLASLENLSGLTSDKIALWTPEQNDRDSCSERAVEFYCYVDGFHVVGGDRFDCDNGCARRVLLETSGRSPAYRSR